VFVKGEVEVIGLDVGFLVGRKETGAFVRGSKSGALVRPGMNVGALTGR